MLQPAMTFDEIGAALGLSHERARQIYEGAIAKLQRGTAMHAARDLQSVLDNRRRYAVPTGPKPTGGHR